MWAGFVLVVVSGVDVGVCVGVWVCTSVWIMGVYMSVEVDVGVRSDLCVWSCVSDEVTVGMSGDCVCVRGVGG